MVTVISNPKLAWICGSLSKSFFHPNAVIIQLNYLPLVECKRLEGRTHKLSIFLQLNVSALKAGPVAHAILYLSQNHL